MKQNKKIMRPTLFGWITDEVHMLNNRQTLHLVVCMSLFSFFFARPLHINMYIFKQKKSTLMQIYPRAAKAIVLWRIMCSTQVESRSCSLLLVTQNTSKLQSWSAVKRQCVSPIFACNHNTVGDSEVISFRNLHYVWIIRLPLSLFYPRLIFTQVYFRMVLKILPLIDRLYENEQIIFDTKNKTLNTVILIVFILCPENLVVFSQKPPI